MASRSPIGSAMLAGQCGACTYALIDLAVVALRSDLGAVALLRGAVVSLGLGLFLGPLVGIAIARPYAVSRAPLTSTVAALAAAVFLWTALWATCLRWASRTFHDRALTALLIASLGVVLLAVAAAAFRIVRRLSAPLDDRLPGDGWWTLAVGLAVAAVVLAFFDRVGAQLCAAALVLHLVAWRSRRRPHTPWVVLATGVVAFLLALGPPGNDEAAHRAEDRHGTFVPLVERALTPLLDLDGDGYLAVFGGGDCAELDAARSPGGVEVPGNAVDEDCRFGDLVDVPRRAAPQQEVNVQRVVLVTVSDLDIDGDGALAPAMPRLQRLIDGGTRFPQSVGLGGSERHVVALLLSGRLPLGIHPRDGALPTGGPTIPWLVERSGGRAAAAVAKELRFDELATQFRHRQSDGAQETAGKVVSRALGLLGKDRVFLWVHLDGTNKRKTEAVDRAAERLIAMLDSQRVAHPYRVMVVGLAPSDRTPGARPPRGGPLAIIGTGVAPATATEPTSMFDVYPTLLHWSGQREPTDVADELPPVAGRVVGVANEHEPALGGWLVSPMVIGTFERDAMVLHRPRARAFELRGPESGTLGEAEREPPAWAAPHLELLRDRFLAPRLAAHNRALESAVTTEWPEHPEGLPVQYAYALTIHGCSVRRLPGEQLELTLFMEGGERLRRSDLLSIKISSPGSGTMRARVIPAGGALPFGRSWRGRRVADRILIDTRRLKPGLATVWVAIRRGKERLAVTKGVGNTRTWGRVCTLEVEK